MGISKLSLIAAFFTLPLTTWAHRPALGPVVRYTRTSLDHFIQSSLIRAEEQDRFQILVTQFTHADGRNSLSSRLERALHARDGHVVDFYQMHFSIADRQSGDELYRVTCQIDDWQSEHYFNIHDCVTRNSANQPLNRSERAGLPYYLTQRLALWFALYSEVEFQNSAR